MHDSFKVNMKSKFTLFAFSDAGHTVQFISRCCLPL